MGWTLKNSLPGFLKQEARLVAVSLATQTQPFGISATSQAVGQVATSRDIYRVYATPGKAFADLPTSQTAISKKMKEFKFNPQKAFWSAVSKSKWDAAKTILSAFGVVFKSTPIQAFDGGKQHRQLRNNQGRIPQSQKPVMIVKNPSALKSYVAAEQKKVGFGKGGWAACARALGGTRGIPGWISRQASPGVVVEQYAAEKSSVIMTNQVPYASEILSPAGKQEAIAVAMDRLRKSIQVAFNFRRT